jgi:hypothetical protein
MAVLKDIIMKNNQKHLLVKIDGDPPENTH